MSNFCFNFVIIVFFASLYAYIQQNEIIATKEQQKQASEIVEFILDIIKLLFHFSH
jgi:hypothetical protein